MINFLHAGVFWNHFQDVLFSKYKITKEILCHLPLCAYFSKLKKCSNSIGEILQKKKNKEKKRKKKRKRFNASPTHFLLKILQSPQELMIVTSLQSQNLGRLSWANCKFKSFYASEDNLVRTLKMLGSSSLVESLPSTREAFGSTSQPYPVSPRSREERERKLGLSQVGKMTSSEL